MVGSHEFLAACDAREALLTGVGAEMALEFVGSRESFATEQPFAKEGTFASVPPEMSLKVTRFTIHLLTAGNVAQVLSLSLLIWPHNRR